MGEMEHQMEATARLAMQTSMDFAEHRAALQGVFFVAGAAKKKCLEVYEAYSRDLEEVMQGTRDKGAPLKIQMYKCIVQLVKEQAIPYPACKQAVEALSNADIGWALASLAGCNKPSEDGKPWILVASFSASEQGRTIRRLWNDASLSGLWSKGSDGSWPLVGFRAGQARTSRECQSVAELSGLPLKGKGKGKSRVSPKRSKSPSRGRDERERKRR